MLMQNIIFFLHFNATNVWISKFKKKISKHRVEIYRNFLDTIPIRIPVKRLFSMALGSGCGLCVAAPIVRTSISESMEQAKAWISNQLYIYRRCVCTSDERASFLCRVLFHSNGFCELLCNFSRKTIKLVRALVTGKFQLQFNQVFTWKSLI